MKDSIEITADDFATESSGLIKRLSVLTYGIVAYAVGCFGLFWLFLGAGGLAPVGISEWKSSSVSTALLVNPVRE